MEYDAAKAELLRHAGITDDFYDSGFLGCLRPYNGIKACNFHSVIEALLSVSESIARPKLIERELVEAVFVITVKARNWAITDGSMLVRNQLISNEDREQMRAWIEIIEFIMLDLLQGQSSHDCIDRYCEYVAEFGWGENDAFFIPLLAAAIETEDVGDRLQGLCAAVAKLGPKGAIILSSLRRARQREWKWYEPHDRCTAEMRHFIDQAVAAVGGKSI